MGQVCACVGAALNHAAFNLGAWPGALVLEPGLGLTAPTWVAGGLTFPGMGVFALAVALERR